MRLLLLQAQVWVPSLGGGNKANRMLLEALARRGHRCAAICRAVTTRAGPTSIRELRSELGRRGAELTQTAPDVYSFHYGGVEVEAVDSSDLETLRRQVQGKVAALEPDWVIVTDDKQRLLLDAALMAAPERVILLVQTVVQLPFGPLAATPDAAQARRFRRARAVVVISEFVRDYLQEHGAVDARLVHLPVYGEGPFPSLGRFDEGSVTMINPCVEKGLPIFLGLADSHPHLDFAAVPTWGADPATLAALSSRPNVRLIEARDDVGEVLAGTRVLVAPSLWPETFGYVVVEAMLRGIPTLASNMGGMPEAKLGVEYVLPVRPALPAGGGYESPEQDLEPWSAALEELLGSEAVYDLCSRRSREAAHRFLPGSGVGAFEALLQELGEEERSASR